jgi:uncharacterized protein YndB with AHSA1/START domain
MNGAATTARDQGWTGIFDQLTTTLQSRKTLFQFLNPRNPMLAKIIIALVVLLIVFAVVVALRPAEFRIARSTVIAAPAAIVFAQVNDFHAWPEFSPWAKLDPAMTTTYAGPAAGVGAAYAWAGNPKVGEGQMTITESRPNELVRIRLEFLKPFKATNTAEFTFKAEGGQTAVTWSMSGVNSFMFKAAGLFMNVDKMVGDDFEKGLANLKAVAESAKK